jgi:uncharacterized membrane protein YphA (DoxX/SURF4 family)
MLRERPTPPFQAAIKRYADLYIIHSAVLVRLAIGIVYTWFGVLKFIGGASPAAGLATSTMSALTFHLVPVGVSLPLLATLETLIGLGFLSGLFPRLTAVAFLVQVTGALSATVLAAHQVWQHAPFEPTLTGQYVIKDLILLTAGLVVITAPGRSASSRLRREPRLEPSLESSRPDDMRESVRGT